MNRTRLALCTLAAVGLLAWAAGQCRADDEAAVRKTVEAYVAAFNRGDAAALAALWTEDGAIVTPEGETVKGRKAIQEGFQRFFKENPGAKVEVKTTSVQVQGGKTATEEGTARVTVAGQPPDESTYTASYVKRDGQWLLASVTEAAAAPRRPTTSNSRSWSG